MESSPCLYHLSATTNRSSILSLGLQTGKDRTGMVAVFLADLPVQEQNHDLWAVATKGLDLEDDNTTPEDGNWFMCFQDIGPERLTLISKE